MEIKAFLFLPDFLKVFVVYYSHIGNVSAYKSYRDHGAAKLADSRPVIFLLI